MIGDLKNLFEFKSIPFLHHRLKALLALCVVLFVVVMSFILMNNYFYSLMALFILVIPVSSFFLPTTYAFGEEGFFWIQLKLKKEFLYKDFHKVFEHPDGLYLEDRKRKKSQFVYIYDENLKKQLFEFLMERVK